MKKKHLCDDCLHEIPTCVTGKIVFGIDKNPHATGAAADIVLECEGYNPTKRVRKNGYPKYTIEPHGPTGQYALYSGRDRDHHGLRLCNLNDFDMHVESTIKMIVERLNQ